MSEKITISGESRQETGKANSRSLRSSEIVPGVLYGEEKSSNIKVMEKDLKKILENPSIFSQVIDLNIDGSPFEVLLKDIQRNPRNDRPSHVDFLVVSKDTKVTVNVPLKFINEDICVGVKQQGGMISHLRNEVEVLCSAASLPEFIEIDTQNIELNLRESLAPYPDFGAEERERSERGHNTPKPPVGSGFDVTSDDSRSERKRRVFPPMNRKTPF